MISEIEAKIEQYIRSILNKEVIDYAEYQTLISHLAHLKMEKRNNENKKEIEEATHSIAKLFNIGGII